MTRFSFIHAADLHLGSPFLGLALKDAGQARAFAEASRTAFTRLVSEALARKVDFFLIAGDVYDGDWKDNKIGLFFNREMARLERAGIPVYLIRGNHDAESQISRTIGLPANVHEFSTRRPETFRIEALRVALHGRSFQTQAETANFVPDYPKAEPGWFNIGLLHTSLTGRDNHARYAPCSLADLLGKGYDYWALGHVHAYEVVHADPPVIFPGNLQGRSVRECGDKGAVLVSVEEGTVRNERLIVDEARFFDLAIDVEPHLDTPEQLLIQIEQAISGTVAELGERQGAIRIRLTGMSPMADRLRAERHQFEDEVQARCHHAHADLWLEKLELSLSRPARTQGRRAPETKGDPGFDVLALLDLLPQADLTERAEAILRDNQALAGYLAGLDAPVALADLVADARALIAGLAGKG